ncbi:protein-export chaperone SecB [Thomasclavelia cocleata]|uniref:protein-export chaperone SecB n=1 Tax=Thomasclavelia cocleata TaxID=69824 RepID=UPI00242E7E34|nr:protein-export chaperone SecB [Thomasclavelia cocleata]
MKSRLCLKTQVKKLTNNDRILSVNVVISVFFKFSNCEEELNRDFDDILKYDSIAILFPYIRTLIQNMTSYDCSNLRILLPPINIKAIVDELDSKEE